MRDDVMGPTVRHNTLHCRACGGKIDASTPLGHTGVPTNGSWSVCLNCAEVSIYVVGPFGVALREPTLGELATFTKRYRGVVGAVLQYNSEHRNQGD